RRPAGGGVDHPGGARGGGSGGVVAVVAHGARDRGPGHDRGRRLPVRRGLVAPRDRGPDRAGVVRLPRARALARPRVPRPAALRHLGDDAHGRRRGSDGGIPRARADVGGGLRARRHQPSQPCRRRGSPQVFPPGRVRLGLPALRDRAGVRRDRDDQPQSDRRAGPDVGLDDSPMLLIGLGLLAVGFGFKVAAVPFHMWAPDVYDGSPTPVTGYMATAVKAAAFAALLRVLGEAFGGVPAWHQIVWWLAVATMVVGNLVALAQRTVKRMLAYSSIAHAGYLLVAVATGTSAGSAAFIFYLVAYTLTTLAAFALLAAKGRDGERDVRIDDLAGLGTSRPWLAFALAVCMLSLL